MAAAVAHVVAIMDADMAEAVAPLVPAVCRVPTTNPPAADRVDSNRHHAQERTLVVAERHKPSRRSVTRELAPKKSMGLRSITTNSGHRAIPGHLHAKLRFANS